MKHLIFANAQAAELAALLDIAARLIDDPKSMPLPKSERRRVAASLDQFSLLMDPDPNCVQFLDDAHLAIVAASLPSPSPSRH